MLAIGLHDGRIRHVDALTGEERWEKEGHLRPIQGVAISRDGRSLASSSADHSFVIWDAPSGSTRLIKRGHDAKDGCTCEMVRDTWATSIALNPDCPVVGHKRMVHAVAFSPCGRKVATGGEDRMVVQWDAQSGEQIMRFKLRHVIFDVKYSLDGTKLAGGGGSSSIVVWHAETGELIRVLRYTHACSLWSISFSPD
jgi:WD40 repeat protein